MDILYCILEISKTYDILEKGSCSYRKHRMFREQFPPARITLCLGTCKFEFANCFHRNPLEVKGGQHAKPTKRKFTFCYTRCTTRQYHISIMLLCSISAICLYIVFIFISAIWYGLIFGHVIHCSKEAYRQISISPKWSPHF